MDNETGRRILLIREGNFHFLSVGLSRLRMRRFDSNGSPFMEEDLV
jgi:hypothetical protein